MFTRLFVDIVSFCRRHGALISLLALITSIGLGLYVVQNIRINTDIDQLMRADLDWRLREKEMDKAFPQSLDQLVIVIDGANPDLAEQGAAKLAKALREQPDLFKTVKRPDAIPYFQKNGLLFLSTEHLAEKLDLLVQAQPMLGGLAKDPSLRGLFETLGLALDGITYGQAKYEQLEPSLAVISQTIQSVLDGQPTILPWQSMMSSGQPSIHEIRKYILTQPVMDFSSLSPGAKASQTVRELARELDLTPDKGVHVRLTGSVALNDEEFASVAEGTEKATVLSITLVLLLLYFALKSVRLILPILLTLFAGLIATTAFALATIGSLNLISVAFAVMFVGIAVDFGIQFGVRFRDELFKKRDAVEAMRSTAHLIAGPFSLAAASTILGFLAFIPTDYRGVSDLGVIAAAGMGIAFILNFTLLPALLSLFKPPAEREPIAYAWARPIDLFLQTHRKKLLGIVALVAAIALIPASQTRFDFDPLNLKNPETESVATLFDIMKDPDSTPYTIKILAPSLAEATTLAKKIETLKEVDHALTLASFVPEDQETKLAMLADATFLLGPSLHPEETLPNPTDEQIYASLKKMADKLRALGPDKTTASKLADQLERVINKKDPATLQNLHTTLISGLTTLIDRLGGMLQPDPVTLKDITSDLKEDWITADGRAKIEVYPKGNGRNHRVLTQFTDAVRAIAPEATGAPISIQESGRTVMGAFIRAGIFAIIAIGLLALFVLRRIVDVFRLLLPLILAGILTLATMVLINLPLNFANVIALPLLLSLGVSYAIYFITYWKNGHENLLYSSMARAVLFSAGTTLVAFGTLSLSSHTGTRGMGELLTLSLIYSGLSTFLVLPLLLNRPRLIRKDA
ncbi:MAG: MMPL family transporter [Alphaproteobacteria bacterium]|nr:MMPL family transporter [Alphaproteobacteria bacterium]